MSWLSDVAGSDAAKLAAKAQKKGTATAEQNWQDTAGLRKLGASKINTAPVDYAEDFAGGPSYSPVNDPLYGQGTEAVGTSLVALTHGPDRMALVQKALADIDAQNAPRLQAGIRKIGQSAASLGRIGNQGVGTSIGDYSLALEQDRNSKANELIRQATDATQADKYATLSAAGDVASGAYGRGASERSNRQGVAQQGVTNRAARIDAERAGNAATFGQGVSLTSLGYGFSPEDAYGREAAAQQATAARKSAAFNDFLKTGAQAAAML